MSGDGIFKTHSLSFETVAEDNNTNFSLQKTILFVRANGHEINSHLNPNALEFVPHSKRVNTQVLKQDLFIENEIKDKDKDVLNRIEENQQESLLEKTDKMDNLNKYLEETLMKTEEIKIEEQEIKLEQSAGEKLLFVSLKTPCTAINASNEIVSSISFASGIENIASKEVIPVLQKENLEMVLQKENLEMEENQTETKGSSSQGETNSVKTPEDVTNSETVTLTCNENSNKVQNINKTKHVSFKPTTTTIATTTTGAVRKVNIAKAPGTSELKKDLKLIISQNHNSDKAIKSTSPAKSNTFAKCSKLTSNKSAAITQKTPENPKTLLNKNPISNRPTSSSSNQSLPTTSKIKSAETVPVQDQKIKPGLLKSSRAVVSTKLRKAETKKVS